MDVSSAHPLHHCTYPRPNTCMHTRMHMHMHICTILRCVSNAVTGCANFAVISALLFGGAHALTLGRPKPFAPDASSVEAYGEEVTTVAIWCAYGLNVLAQSLALGIIITSNPNPNPNPNHSPSQTITITQTLSLSLTLSLPIILTLTRHHHHVHLYAAAAL